MSTEDAIPREAPSPTVLVPVTLEIPGFDLTLPWPRIDRLNIEASKREPAKFDVYMHMLGHHCEGLRVNAIGLETLAMVVQAYQRNLMRQGLHDAAVLDHVMTVNRGGNGNA